MLGWHAQAANLQTTRLRRSTSHLTGANFYEYETLRLRTLARSSELGSVFSSLLVLGAGSKVRLNVLVASPRLEIGLLNVRQTPSQIKS